MTIAYEDLQRVGPNKMPEGFRVCACIKAVHIMTKKGLDYLRVAVIRCKQRWSYEWFSEDLLPDRTIAKDGMTTCRLQVYDSLKGKPRHVEELKCVHCALIVVSGRAHQGLVLDWSSVVFPSVKGSNKFQDTAA
jgi:hypothetical protein